MSKLFLKTLFNNIKGVSFTVELWDGETIKVGEGEDEFTVIIKEPSLLQGLTSESPNSL